LSPIPSPFPQIEFFPGHCLVFFQQIPSHRKVLVVFEVPLLQCNVPVLCALSPCHASAMPSNFSVFSFFRLQATETLSGAVSFPIPFNFSHSGRVSFLHSRQIPLFFPPLLFVPRSTPFPSPRTQKDPFSSFFSPPLSFALPLISDSFGQRSPAFPLNNLLHFFKSAGIPFPPARNRYPFSQSLSFWRGRGALSISPTGSGQTPCRWTLSRPEIYSLLLNEPPACYSFHFAPAKSMPGARWLFPPVTPWEHFLVVSASLPAACF